jgi:hypothetical protein
MFMHRITWKILLHGSYDMLWECIYMWNDGILSIDGCIHFIARKWLEKSFEGQNIIYNTS